MKTLIAAFAVLGMTLSAAEVTGTWKAVAKDNTGEYRRTFIFKQDGAKLTGKTFSDRWGKSTIENGKIEGDVLTFSITILFEIGDLKVFFTGKPQGDVMKLTAEASGRTLEFIAKRVP